MSSCGRGAAPRPNLCSACFWFFIGAPQNRLAKQVPAFRMGTAPFETEFCTWRGEVCCK
jgi:hypothetical protein